MVNCDNRKETGKINYIMILYLVNYLVNYIKIIKLGLNTAVHQNYFIK